MPPLNHAVCSPSSAKRWIHCPPSALANAAAPRKDTVHTREGTLAHEFCEIKARSMFNNAPSEGLEELRKHELYQPEMDRYTDMYVDALVEAASRLKDPYIVVEQKLSFDPLIPDTFGTADCILMDSDTIHVCDFKYGKGVAVSAEHNEQMMMYAVGAIFAYGDFADFRTVRMSIIQPRISETVSTWECTYEELAEWLYGTMEPAAQLALKGEGEYASGPWCKWCVNEANCRKRRDDFAAFDSKPLPPVLSDAEVAEALEMAGRLTDWVKALKEHAYNTLLDGGEIPGWMLAEGRSTRQFRDIGKAFDIARQNGVPDEMLYERVPVTLTGLEKIMGKKKFAETMQGVVDKPKGDPTLAPVSAGRKPYKGNTAEDDFAEPI